jgi:hypothetical protein
LVAFAGLLMAYFRQSKRRTALFLETLLPSQPHLGIDESPTKEAATKAWLWTSTKAWLWTFVAGLFTVFAVRGTRAATALTELLTDAFTGVVVCDRAKMYWGLGRLQWCCAHLARDFQALADSEDGVVKRLGRDLLRPTRELFRQWSRCRFVETMLLARRARVAVALSRRC